MVEQTNQPQLAEEIEIDESGFISGEAFKPTEFFSLNEIVSCRLVRMDNDRLQRFGVNVDSAEFKAAFPNGVPALEIGLKGIDIEYAYAPDRIKRVTIPTYSYQGDSFGQPKGDRSQLDITAKAFEKVFGVKPFGNENRQKLIGRKARWGQHIDSAEIDKTERTWRWDIPREALPADYQYTGEVRVFAGRQGGAAGESDSSSSSVGVKTLSQQEALVAILNTIEGHETSDVNGGHAKILNIPGLPQEFLDQAAERSLVKNLFAEGLLEPDAEQKKVVITAKGNAIRNPGQAATGDAAPAPDAQPAAVGS